MCEDDREPYASMLDDVWPRVRRVFNYPFVSDVRLSDEPTGGDGAYRWRDDEVVLSRPFLERLDLSDDGECRAVVETLLKHEVGHYVLFPKELVSHATYLQRATEVFGDDYGSRYYAIYADVCVDLRLLDGGYVDEEVLDLRELTLEASPTASSDVEETVQRRVHRLLVGIYQETFEDVERRIELTELERSWLEPFLEIDYFVAERAKHERNVVRFGSALERALADIPGRDVRDYESPLDAGKRASERAFSGDEPGAIDDAVLGDALDRAAAEGGRDRYERLREFFEAEADFTDPMAPEETESGAAGVAPGAFEWHDELVPFYRRWARTVPLYVADGEVPVADADRYRRGRRPFEIDDPIADVNAFASYGVVGVPGVTKVDTYADGAQERTRRSTPDLLLGLDSSASMPHPTEESPAVLAAFVLASTYRRNGAEIGCYNFGTEVAFQPPTTDLSAIHSLACGYWGGGTVFDHRTLAEFLDTADSLEGVAFSSTAEYERLMASVGAGAESTPPFREVAPGVDHVLISDGDVRNEASLVDHVDDTADHVRTMVFLTDAAAAERWRAADLDAHVYEATDEEDLLNQVVGVARRRVAGE